MHRKFLRSVSFLRIDGSASLLGHRFDPSIHADARHDGILHPRYLSSATLEAGIGSAVIDSMIDGTQESFSQSA